MVKKQLHTGARWAFRLQALFSALFLVIFLTFFLGGILTASKIDPFKIFISSIFFIIIAIIVIIEVYARLAYKFWFYEFTSDQLRIEKGIIWKRYSNIPYQRIQNVDITRGIIARILGFSSVNIQTAGYSMPVRNHAYSEGYIPAVSVKEAEQIREFVIKK